MAPGVVKTKAKGKAGVKKDEDDPEGMVEGVSSAHSWIKAQTMIRPSKLGTVNVKHDDDNEDDEVSNEVLITLSSRDPNASHNQIW